MAKAVKTKPAKYTDKSSGQPELVLIFKDLREVLCGYAKGNYTVKADKPGQYELYYDKEVEQKGKIYPEMPFAALLIQKGYVGFYFLPFYMDDSLKRKLWPDLMKTLKGKACFHIKKNDAALTEQIKNALQTGYAYFKSKGWE